MSLVCKEAGPAGVRYVRHRPEHTPLYGLVEQYYPQFLEELEARDECVPAYVRREFEATSSVVGWNTAFCGCAASGVMPRARGVQL